MADIGILWRADQVFDWAQNSNGDIADTNAVGMIDLETSVVISLFTDRTVPPDWVFRQKGIINNARGWWGDAYNSRQIGSHLWLLREQSGASNLLQIARNYCDEALQHLIDDGVAASIDVETSWLFPNSTRAMGIAITIVEPITNVSSTFKYSFAWGEIRNVPETPPTVTTALPIGVWDITLMDQSVWAP